MKGQKDNLEKEIIDMIENNGKYCYQRPQEEPFTPYKEHKLFYLPSLQYLPALYDLFREMFS